MRAIRITSFNFTAVLYHETFTAKNAINIAKSYIRKYKKQNGIIGNKPGIEIAVCNYRWHNLINYN